MQVQNPNLPKYAFYSRLIVGGQDGSVTILVIAPLEDEKMTDEETIAQTANYLRNLPSRRIHKGAKTKTRRPSKEIEEDAIDRKEVTDDEEESTSTLNTFEERMRDERRQVVRRKFRYRYITLYCKANR